MSTSNHFFITLRKPGSGTSFGQWTSSKTRYLSQPVAPNEDPEEPEVPTLDHCASNFTAWFAEVLAAAQPPGAPASGPPEGDILFFVHGYATDLETAKRQHLLLRNGLANIPGPRWHGVVVTFDWPCTGGYFQDRGTAYRLAPRFVADVIDEFAARIQPHWKLKLHVLARSMGCFLVRQAFEYADNLQAVGTPQWKMHELVFMNGDVSSKSMGADDRYGAPLYRRCNRLTNYSSQYDTALQASAALRLFSAKRVGAIGLPQDAPDDKAVNVDGSTRWGRILDTNQIPPARLNDVALSHYWMLYDALWHRDLARTLTDDPDLPDGPTREPDGRRWILAES